MTEADQAITPENEVPVHFPMSDMMRAEMAWSPKLTMSYQLTMDTTPRPRYVFRGVLSPIALNPLAFFSDDQDEKKREFGDVEILSTKTIGVMDISIIADCYIVISLDPAIFDHWQFRVAAFTVKRSENSDLYANLRYLWNGSWLRGSALPRDARPMVVAFGAKWDRPSSKPSDLHGFNMNVVISGTPISIDPDMRNPRDP